MQFQKFGEDFFVSSLFSFLCNEQTLSFGPKPPKHKKRNIPPLQAASKGRPVFAPRSL